MRLIWRSTFSGAPAQLLGAAALLGVSLHAFSASAQQRTAAASNAPVVAPAPRFTLDLPVLEQEKRAAEADAAEAARDDARNRAEITRERLAAEADAQAPAARTNNPKGRSNKVPDAANAKQPPSAKSKRSAAEDEPSGDATASVIGPAVALPAEPEPASKAKPKPAAKPEPAAKAKGKQATKAPAKPAGRQPTEAYRKLRDSWHAPMDAVPTVDTPGRIPLVLSAVNLNISVSLTPKRDDGGFDEADLQRAASAFAPRDMKGVHPIAPRLLDLVYRAMRHFEAPVVHIISGYRKDRAGSRHTQGRAIDMALPGVSNEALAEHVRSYGFCGVGIYPKSGFVHLDVRDRSYFWVDNSLPGERSRSNPILPDEAMASDRAASARGETPDTYVPDNDAEDRAAARSYARRAKLRRERALREAARAQQRNQAANPDGSKPSVQRAGML